MHARASLRRTGGFSFIEILVVMGIIAVLAGLGVVIINIVRKNQPKQQTQVTVLKVKAVIDQWKQGFYDFPPSTLEGLVKLAGMANPKYASRNATNEGIEALYQALHAAGFKGNVELSEDEVSNIDDDRLQQALTSRGVDLREIKDAYGNPLVYFVNTEYVKREQDPPTYETAIPADQVNPKPYRESGGGFVNPNGFQIYSMGADGIPNTDDDIKGW